MYKTLIKKLVTLAEVRGYHVNFQCYSKFNSALMYRSSVTLPEKKTIVIYYNDDFIKLVVLCHELGHVIQGQLKDYSKRQAFYERKASLWVCRFLKRNGFKDLARVKALLNISLQGYGARII
jgi:hypothetical protein